MVGNQRMGAKQWLDGSINQSMRGNDLTKKTGWFLFAQLEAAQKELCHINVHIFFSADTMSGAVALRRGLPQSADHTGNLRGLSLRYLFRGGTPLVSLQRTAPPMTDSFKHQTQEKQGGNRS